MYFNMLLFDFYRHRGCPSASSVSEMSESPCPEFSLSPETTMNNNNDDIVDENDIVDYNPKPIANYSPIDDSGAFDQSLTTSCENDDATDVPWRGLLRKTDSKINLIE
jgi:hypothetical protein